MPARGAGTTTRQIQTAPKNAIYVWVSGNTSYALLLARELNRFDLAVVGPEEVRSVMRGRGDTPIVVDHAAKLSVGTQHLVRQHNDAIAPPAPPVSAIWANDTPKTSYGDAW